MHTRQGTALTRELVNVLTLFGAGTLPTLHFLVTSFVTDVSVCKHNLDWFLVVVSFGFVCTRHTVLVVHLIVGVYTAIAVFVFGHCGAN